MQEEEEDGVSPLHIFILLGGGCLMSYEMLCTAGLKWAGLVKMHDRVLFVCCFSIFSCPTASFILKVSAVVSSSGELKFLSEPTFSDTEPELTGTK